MTKPEFLHRIVRAMHDGECPKCHRIYAADRMRTNALYDTPGGARQRRECPYYVCPGCGFTITDDEAASVISIFSQFMDKNLAIFEAWRAKRQQQVRDVRTASPSDR